MSAADLFRVLRRLASQNLGLKVVALALAVAAWWFVAGESKVLVSFTVPLEIRNVPKGLTMTNKPERQVEVRLSGPSSLLSGMRPSEISAGVDLTVARAGRQSFTLDDPGGQGSAGDQGAADLPFLDRGDPRPDGAAVVPVSARIGGGTRPAARIAKVEIDPQ